MADVQLLPTFFIKKFNFKKIVNVFSFVSFSIVKTQVSYIQSTFQYKS